VHAVPARLVGARWNGRAAVSVDHVCIVASGRLRACATPRAYYSRMRNGPHQIEGVTFESKAEPRPGGGATCRIRFLIDGAWSGAESVDFLGEPTGGTHWAAVEQAWAKVKTGDDFIPWALPAASIRFFVWIDGQRHAARVSRECLEDYHLADWTGTRGAFAASPQAQRLRDLALQMIRSGREPLVTRDDWQHPPSST